MKINRKLIPIKGHFFLFNAGTAPLVPYLSTYARQLGFSSATVGLIYTVLPIFGLIVKPLFGVIADKFKKQKFIFILFQVVTIVTFSAIYFIPGNGSTISVELDCGNGVTVLKSCFQSEENIDTCKLTSLGNENITARCNMNCNMSSLRMWETVCEHWGIPQYCYNNTSSLKYISNINSVALKDKCAYMSVSNVTLDGYDYIPHCRIGGSYVDINVPCALDCSNQNYSNVINDEKPFMTCVNEILNYRLCVNDIAPITRLINESLTSDCKASCELDPKSPWRLMEICEGWQADAADTCRPKMPNGQHFPSNFSFIATVKLHSTISEHECVYVELKHIELPNYNTIYYPNCIEQAPHEETVTLFHPSCEINCDNIKLNEIFQEAQDNTSRDSQFTTQFWLFFFMMILSWIGQAVVVTFADAICFNLLGTKLSLYGKQRLWGSVGWGIFSLMTGALIDVYSDGAYKDYTVAFILMFIFMSGDVIVSMFIKVEATKMSMNILADVGTLFSSLPSFVFILWTIAVGLCTGLLWQFLFWHIEDVSKLSCDGSDYVKTLQGLVSAIQTFCGEIPFLFVSGTVLKKLGHLNMMTLVLFAFGVRFILYSILTNPWWVLPIEMFQGITFGMFYPTMTSYATVVSPPGTETTVQGLVGAVFEGVGTSLGSLIGGQLYERYGGWNTFQWFGLGSLCCCFLHVIAQYTLQDKIVPAGLKQGYSTIIRYQQPNDTVFILEEENDETRCTS